MTQISFKDKDIELFFSMFFRVFKNFSAQILEWTPGNGTEIAVAFLISQGG